MLKWLIRLKLKRSAKYVILVTSVLAVFFAGFTIYGLQVGNFVIGVEKDKKVQLSLYDNEEFINPTSRLTFDGLREQTNTTYSAIPTDIDIGIGNKTDRVNSKFLAYSFYLKNESDYAITLDMEMRITKVTKGVDSAIRVMIISNGETNIYAKPKEFPADQIGQPEDFPYQTAPFMSPVTICESKITNFNIGSVLKYTVVVWLEGEDAQCVDDIKGGTIKMDIKFKGY